MPIYTVKDTQTGKTIKFNWTQAEPPTDTDMEEVMQSARGGMPDTSPQEESSADKLAKYGGQSVGQSAMQDIKEVGTGMVQGVGELAKTAYNVFNPIPSQNPVVQAGKGAIQSAQRGTLGRDIVEAGKSLFEPTAQRIVDVTAPQVVPIATNGMAGVKQAIKNIPQSAEAVARKPASYAMDLATIIPASKSVSAAKTVAKMAPERIAPFAAKVDVPAMQAAGRIGVELPASAASKMPAVSLVETIAGKGLFGSKTVDRITKAQEQMNTIGTNMINRAKGSTDMAITGNQINKSLQDFKKNYYETRTALYDDFEQMGGRVLPASVNETKKTLRDIIIQKKEAFGATEADAKLFTDILNDVERFKQPQFRNLKATRSKLSQMLQSTDPVATGNKANIGNVVGALTKDMDATVLKHDIYPEGWAKTYKETIQKADGYYKEGLDKLNNQLSQKIETLIDQKKPEKIVPYLLERNTTKTQIDDLLNTIAPETKEYLEASTIKSILDKAKGTNEFYTPAGITRELKNIGHEKLSSLLKPEQIKKLEDLATVSKAMGRTERIAQGSQTAFSGRLFGTGAIGFSNPLLAAKIIAGDAAVSAFVGSKPGQKLLTTGFKGPRQAVESAAVSAVKSAPVTQAGFRQYEVGKYYTTQKGQIEVTGYDKDGMPLVIPR